MRRFLIFAALFPPLAFGVAFWGMLQIMKLGAGRIQHGRVWPADPSAAGLCDDDRAGAVHGGGRRHARQTERALSHPLDGIRWLSVHLCTVIAGAADRIDPRTLPVAVRDHR